MSVFINYQQFAHITKEVLRQLKEEDQSLVADRIRVTIDGKNSKTVQVVTDRERFIQKMVKRGVRLKQPK